MRWSKSWLEFLTDIILLIHYFPILILCSCFDTICIVKSSIKNKGDLTWIEDISDRHLTLKTVLLLAISSLKRVGDLQAMLVAPTHLDFAPRAGYFPKVSSVTPHPVVLQAFSPPFREPDHQRLNCMLSSASTGCIRPQSCPVEKGGPTADLLWSP